MDSEIIIHQSVALELRRGWSKQEDRLCGSRRQVKYKVIRTQQTT